jgi:thiol-disulfide isomerase/thioredoxin
MNADPNEIPIDDGSGIEERPQNRREWAGVARSLVLPLLIVGTIVGVLLYIERERNSGSSGDGRFGIVALPDALNPTGRSPSTDVGRAAPDFLLQTPDGGELRFSDLRGKPVLVNFWASWCTPCRKEMPEIVRAYDANGSDSLIVVAIDLQENDRQVKDFADEYGMRFPVVIDRTGQVAEAWRIGGPIEGIPSSYFIDAGGIVRARVFGPMDAERIEEELAKVIE